MIGETLGLTLSEVMALSVEEVAIWRGWFALKIHEQKVAARRNRPKKKPRRRH